MRTRFLVPTLAAIAVAGVLAVPALAQPEVVTPQLQKVSKRALVKANVALRVARQAKRQAREALERPPATQTHVVESPATPTPPPAPSTQIVSATEAATVTAGAEIGEFEAKGGPSLQVTVPSSGLIEVWAQVEIDLDEGGAVGLYEDGQKVPGISSAELCEDDSVLIELGGGGPEEFSSASTPPVPSFVGCGSLGAPSSLLLSRPPGPHTYELRYSECSCPGVGDAEFRNRTLRIAPRP